MGANGSETGLMERPKESQEKGRLHCVSNRCLCKAIVPCAGSISATTKTRKRMKGGLNVANVDMIMGSLTMKCFTARVVYRATLIKF